MFSETKVNKELDRIFEKYQVPSCRAPQLDLLIENHLAIINKLQNDLNKLREELTYHKKIHGEITDSLDEFFTIQRLSSIITEKLEYEQIVKNLDEIAQKVVPHLKSAVFLLENEQITSVVNQSSKDFDLIIKNMREEGILDWLWEQGHPIVIPVQDFLVANQLKVNSGNMVIAPMILNQKGVGVYILHTEKDQSQFSFRDLELLNILTQQAAIAIQYTRLFKKLERTHEALKNSQARLMQTIKLATVGELAGGIAHEINNPLQIILGNVQMALMGYKTENNLKIVEAQAIRIANIVRGLLSMAKQNSISKSEYIEINSLIVNTLNLVRGQIEKRGIKLNLELADKLPLVKGSSIYFQQIFLNFILHAKKQIDQNGTIFIRSYQGENSNIFVEIRDTGIPMPSEYIEKILDPFKEMSNSTEMNLGMSVSVQMVRDIGGEISIDSAENKGNNITIQIPKVNKDEVNYDANFPSTG